MIEETLGKVEPGEEVEQVRSHFAAVLRYIKMRKSEYTCYSIYICVCVCVDGLPSPNISLTRVLRHLILGLASTFYSFFFLSLIDIDPI